MAIVTVGTTEVIVEQLNHWQPDRVLIELHESELHPLSTIEIVVTLKDGKTRKLRVNASTLALTK